jgi:hypothetical protein
VLEDCLLVKESTPPAHRLGVAGELPAEHRGTEWIQEDLGHYLVHVDLLHTHLAESLAPCTDRLDHQVHEAAEPSLGEHRPHHGAVMAPRLTVLGRDTGSEDDAGRVEFGAPAVVRPVGDEHMLGVRGMCQRDRTAHPGADTYEVVPLDPPEEAFVAAETFHECVTRRAKPRKAHGRSSRRRANIRANIVGDTATLAFQ